MPTEVEARIRHQGAGLLIGRNKDRNRLDQNDWFQGTYSNEK
jgi:hypothetical protein